MPGWLLPKQLELDDSGAAVRAALDAAPCGHLPGGSIEVPVVPLTPALTTALRRADERGHLRRGLDTAVEVLAGERRGLTLAARRTGRPPGERLSRLVLLADDGAERFYRQVEQRCLAEHVPRVAAVMLAADSTTLGAALYGPGATVKLVLVDHKDAVADVLRALARG